MDHIKVILDPHFQSYFFNYSCFFLCSPMNRQRSGAGVIAHGQYIYIAGGMDNSGYLNSMERYDTDKDVWIPLSPMPTARSALTLAVLENRIYAIGGYAYFFSLAYQY